MSISQPGTEGEKYPPSEPSEETIQETQPFSRPPGPPPGRNRNRLLPLIAFIIVVLLILATSIGLLVYAQLAQHQQGQVTPTPQPTTTPGVTQTTAPTQPPTATPTAPPLPLQWTAVLNGYKLTSLAVAPTNANVLYACAVPPGLPQTLAGVQTVLRSADAGNHWQDIGKNAGMSRGCELTVSPTDSYEIYVSTSSAAPENPQVPSLVLKHTTTGGDSWETIQPTVHGPGLQITPAWQGTHLSFAGTRLYSLQSLPIPPMPTPTGHQGSLPTRWTRLLMSTDGGKTWGILDSQFYQTWQSPWLYRVNPAAPGTIYELVSPPGFMAGQLPVGELYKSVDGGTTWQALLKQIPTTMSTQEIYQGSDNPDVLFIQARCPSAQAVQQQPGTGPLARSAGATLELCMSRDAGANWQAVTLPSSLSRTMYGGLIDAQGRFYASTFSSTPAEVWRYDPASDTWSRLTTEPAGGIVMLVSPAGANGRMALWFLRTAQGQYTLYRSVI